MSRSTPSLTGRRFGRLTVVAPVWAGRGIHWLCDCSCGSQSVVATTSLTGGATKSCGCLKRLVTTKRNTKHGCSKRGAPTHEYTAWQRMLSRCDNRNDAGYHNYGGRGIAVCERWRDFRNFLHDLGRKPSAEHTLERTDVDGDYRPDNCRWATHLEQANNTRRNVWIEARGERKTMSQWARELDASPATIRDRLRRGWLPEEAVTIPPQHLGYTNRARVEVK